MVCAMHAERYSHPCVAHFLVHAHPCLLDTHNTNNPQHKGAPTKAQHPSTKQQHLPVTAPMPAHLKAQTPVLQVNAE